MTNELPAPPKTYKAFLARYPKIGEAWEIIREAGGEGPMDEKTAYLVRIGIAFGAMREGVVRSSIRKALARNVSREEIEQVIALSASTIGLSSTVTVYSWARDVLETSETAGNKP